VFEFEYALAESIASWRTGNGGVASALRALADANVLKGGALVALALSAVARRGEPLLSARNGFLIRFSIAAVAAITAGRLLQMALPHRDRPIVHLSSWAAESSFGSESSFPSDHAVFMTAMAAAICFADRRLGALAVVWTSFIILLPRVLLSFHYPTDMIAGALLGALIAAAVMKAPMPRAATERVAAVEANAPHIVYPLAFLLAFSIATNFESARAAARVFLNLL
jgi:undecaprenyl-diphosphatase